MSHEEFGSSQGHASGGVDNVPPDSGRVNFFLLAIICHMLKHWSEKRSRQLKLGSFRVLAGALPKKSKVTG